MSSTYFGAENSCSILYVLQRSQRVAQKCLFFLDHKYDLLFCFFRECMEDGRSMTTFYHCYVNHQSRLQSNTFSKLSYIFLICTSKCAADYVIWFEVYDDFIGQKILKLWRQESQPFGLGWSAQIKSICSWTFSHWPIFGWNVS